MMKFTIGHTFSIPWLESISIIHPMVGILAQIFSRFNFFIKGRFFFPSAGARSFWSAASTWIIFLIGSKIKKRKRPDCMQLFLFTRINLICSIISGFGLASPDAPLMVFLLAGGDKFDDRFSTERKKYYFWWEKRRFLLFGVIAGLAMLSLNTRGGFFYGLPFFAYGGVCTIDSC